jgi:hypothetical protein
VRGGGGAREGKTSAKPPPHTHTHTHTHLIHCASVVPTSRRDAPRPVSTFRNLGNHTLQEIGIPFAPPQDCRHAQHGAKWELCCGWFKIETGSSALLYLAHAPFRSLRAIVSGRIQEFGRVVGERGVAVIDRLPVSVARSGVRLSASVGRRVQSFKMVVALTPPPLPSLTFVALPCPVDEHTRLLHESERRVSGVSGDVLQHTTTSLYRSAWCVARFMKTEHHLISGTIIIVVGN